MATQNFTLLASPQFPQPFAGAIDRLISRVDQVLTRNYLGECAYETPESHYGACDGEPCCDPATVVDLVSDQPLCLKHFRRVELQHELARLEASRG